MCTTSNRGALPLTVEGVANGLLQQHRLLLTHIAKEGFKKQRLVVESMQVA